MYLSFISIFLSMIFSGSTIAQERSYAGKRDTIVIEGNLLLPNKLPVSTDRPTTSIQEVSFSILPFDYVDESVERKTIKVPVVEGRVKFSMPADKAYYISSDHFLFTAIFMEPGDRIIIDYFPGQQESFRGNAAALVELQYKIALARRKPVKEPSKYTAPQQSPAEYTAWMDYLDTQVKSMVELIDAYQDKISTRAYNYLRTLNVRLIEQRRLFLFATLSNYVYAHKEMGLQKNLLDSVWDHTQANKAYGKWLRSQSEYYTSGDYFYRYVRLAARRFYHFDFTNDTLQTNELRKLAYYRMGKELYKGQTLQRFYLALIPEQFIMELGPLSEITQSVLQDYYAQPGYSKFKEQMNREYREIFEKFAGKKWAHFFFKDKSGAFFSNQQVSGKIVLMDFWFTGCSGCVQMTPALKKLEQAFRQDTNIVFLSISTDKDKDVWLRSIQQGKYTSGDAVNLYTGGQGSDHPAIQYFNISSYPSLFLVGADGRFVPGNVPDPRSKEGYEELFHLLKEKSDEMNAKALKKQHFMSHDGPYIFYNGPNTSAHSFLKNEVVIQSPVNSFTVQTDKPGKTFAVSKKPAVGVESSVYARPEKLLALSDIEGNFEAFRLWLQKNEVIDEDLNWTFGKGHLVFAGDMFDRGLQVTECLWLVYALEEKAKAAGGHVHFVLGNHEIMNMQGDHRYVDDKYKTYAERMGKTLTQLYDETTELGRWLRTKNIVEKIGDLLFTHGGISPAVNKMSLSLEQMNELARPFYGGGLDSSNNDLLILYNASSSTGRTSPFWYRNYYEEEEKRLPVEEVDGSLKKFEVTHIITGHTVVADTISTWYNNKVINLDTKHAKGHSEALLVEGNTFYRVNARGERFVLFTEEKN